MILADMLPDYMCLMLLKMISVGQIILPIFLYSLSAFLLVKCYRIKLTRMPAMPRVDRIRAWMHEIIKWPVKETYGGGDFKTEDIFILNELGDLASAYCERQLQKDMRNDHSDGNDQKP